MVRNALLSFIVFIWVGSGKETKRTVGESRNSSYGFGFESLEVLAYTLAIQNARRERVRLVIGD